MNNSFLIFTDSNSDLPWEYYEQNNLKVISLSYTIENSTYETYDVALSRKDFYNKMRAGSMPITAQVNPKKAVSAFEPYLQQGCDILYIGFSSALSGTYNSCMIAANELNEKYPDRKIICVDSLCASLGMGLLISKAIKLHGKGKGLEEVAKWVEDNKLNICHLFTVDDLNHLFRGGRVSRATAFFGTMLGIKPVLHVNNEGKLIPIGKARGRKSSLTALIDRMEEIYFPEKNDSVFISHGDCFEEAQNVADMIKKRFKINTFLINYVGPTIGAHSGPGTIAIFFIGSER